MTQLRLFLEKIMYFFGQFFYKSFWWIEFWGKIGLEFFQEAKFVLGKFDFFGPSFFSKCSKKSDLYRQRNNPWDTWTVGGTL